MSEHNTHKCGFAGTNHSLIDDAERWRKVYGFLLQNAPDRDEKIEAADTARGTWERRQAWAAELINPRVR